MLDITTPLKGASHEAEGLSLRELPDFTLTLMAGTTANLTREAGELPTFGKATKSGKNTLFRVAPNQLLVLGPEPECRLCHVTPLSSGRCRIEVSGAKARTLLAACAPVDFSAGAFGKNAVAMTGIHHTPVLVHALGDDTFHLYGLRSFAQNLWEWLVDAAQGLR